MMSVQGKVLTVAPPKMVKRVAPVASGGVADYPLKVSWTREPEGLQYNQRGGWAAGGGLRVRALGEAGACAK